MPFWNKNLNMQTERFKKFMKFIFKWECVFKKGHWGDYDYVTWENVSDDSGGVTRYGIDYSSHKELGIDGIKNLTMDKALEIYWQEWTDAKIEDRKEKLGEVYFNACVNAGIGRANKLLEKSKNADEFINNQELFYNNLAKSKPKLKKFLVGWLNRTKDLRKFLDL